jgi:hypothetical protein
MHVCVNVGTWNYGSEIRLRGDRYRVQAIAVIESIVRYRHKGGGQDHAQ